MPNIKYTKELLEPIVKECFSYRGVTIKLGLKPHGGFIDHIKKRIILYKIDTTHFLGKHYYRVSGKNKKKSPEEILIKGDKTKSKQLKRALLETGEEEKCSVCGITSWNGKELNFEIDHKDGDNTNNVKENLRFICPNCHSQTLNYKFYNRKHK